MERVSSGGKGQAAIAGSMRGGERRFSHAVNLNGVSFVLAIPQFPYLSPRECHLPRLMAQSLVEQAIAAGFGLGAEDAPN